MVLVIPTQKLPPGVPRLPRGATHSGRSAGPASPRYRHSSRPRAAPPGTARGHRHTLGRAEEGGVTRCSVLPCRSLRDRRPRPRPPGLTSGAVGPVAAQLAHLTGRSVEALVAAALPAAQKPVLALSAARAHPTQAPRARLAQGAEETRAAVGHLQGGGKERPHRPGRT